MMFKKWVNRISITLIVIMSITLATFLSNKITCMYRDATKYLIMSQYSEWNEILEEIIYEND